MCDEERGCEKCDVTYVKLGLPGVPYFTGRPVFKLKVFVSRPKKLSWDAICPVFLLFLFRVSKPLIISLYIIHDSAITLIKLLHTYMIHDALWKVDALSLDVHPFHLFPFQCLSILFLKVFVKGASMTCERR